MGLFNKEKKKRKYRWNPLWCHVSDLLHIMHEELETDAPIIALTIEYHGKEHAVGISADYKNTQGFFDYEFYADEDKYKTWDDFLTYACIDGQKLVEISEPIAVLHEELTGNPQGYKYLASREIKSLPNG